MALPKISGNANGLMLIRFDFVKKPHVRGSIQNQPVEQIIQTIHKPQERNKHRDTEGNTHSRHQRLPPPRQKQRLSYVCDKFVIHLLGLTSVVFVSRPLRISALM
jgi:hypothetical protein